MSYYHTYQFVILHIFHHYYLPSLYHISADFSGGKRDENLILPLNDSVSATLSIKQVSSYPTLMLKNLNDIRGKITKNVRSMRWLKLTIQCTHKSGLLLVDRGSSE